VVNIVLDIQKQITALRLQEKSMSASNKTSNGIDMSAYWLPFTPNRYFHQHPKIMQSAKGAYY
jgi:beta-alanine--pyruvate transaminase